MQVYGRISSAKCLTVISLLQEGYSVHQIQSQTDLRKSTIGRIKKKVDKNKENSKGGRSSKLSAYNKQSIIHQITSGKLDNAVQATHFINDILPNLNPDLAIEFVAREKNTLAPLPVYFELDRGTEGVQ